MALLLDTGWRRAGFGCGRILAATAVVGALASFSESARAEGLPPSDERALSAFAAGAVAAAGPLVIGGTRMAIGADVQQKNSGWVIAMSGMSLAPIASHVAVRSYAGAVLFGIVPVLATGTVATLVAVSPEGIYSGNTGTRTTFAVSLSACAFVSTLGVFDAMTPIFPLHKPRDASATSSLSIVPSPGGFAVRGTF